MLWGALPLHRLQIVPLLHNHDFQKSIKNLIHQATAQFFAFLSIYFFIELRFLNCICSNKSCTQCVVNLTYNV